MWCGCVYSTLALCRSFLNDSWQYCGSWWQDDNWGYYSFSNSSSIISTIDSVNSGNGINNTPGSRFNSIQ